MERAQILVHPEREAHPRDPILGRLTGGGAGLEHHALGGGLRDAHHHRLLAVVEQPFEHAPAVAQHPVHAAVRR